MPAGMRPTIIANHVNAAIATKPAMKWNTEVKANIPKAYMPIGYQMAKKLKYLMDLRVPLAANISFLVSLVSSTPLNG